MMTLRRRLLLLLLPTLAVLMLAGGFADYLIATATTRDAYDRALASAALAIAAHIYTRGDTLVFSPSASAPTPTLTPAPVPVSESARPAGPIRSSARVAYLGPIDGELFSITAPDGSLIAGAAHLPSVRPVTASEDTRWFGNAEIRGQRLRVVTLLSPTPLGAATVTVAETLERRARAARIMLFGKLLVDFTELDVALICIWIAVYFGLRPLRRLQDQVESRAPRELPRFDETGAPGEVRPLLRAFNRLLELLRDAAESQRRFVADAAHQMRTPVAGLLAQLELLQQQPAAAPLKSDLALINRGVQRLSHSANQLLALARAEPLSSLPEQFRAVPAVPLIKELIERNLSRADAAGLDLGAELQSVDLNGDAALLEDLVGNLIDNAIKYTPTGGRITVRCGVLPGGSPFIEVEDNGPGIPEADRVRVRERFYRRPGSASSGCGLGLAIVDEITRAHAATLSIESGSAGDGSGARMRVKFPRA